jgi:hypothetical protein
MTFIWRRSVTAPVPLKVLLDSVPAKSTSTPAVSPLVLRSSVPLLVRFPATLRICVVIVPLAGLIDVDKECARLRAEVAELGNQISSREGRLNNAKYVERAPAQVVANDRAILEEMKGKRDQLVEKVRSLCGA